MDGPPTKKARTQEDISTDTAAVSISMDGGANDLPPLPHGVYFNPNPRESAEYLDRFIAGADMPDAEGSIFEADVYKCGPDELRRSYNPSIARDGDHRWFFFSEYKLQSARGKRGDRSVSTGGHWKMDQTRKETDQPAGFRRRTFKFNQGGVMRKKDEGEEAAARWLMEEYVKVSTEEGVGGRRTVPALCKIYLSPRVQGEERRAVQGEDRLVVPADCFDALAELLPPGSVRLPVVQEPEAPPPPPPPPSAFDVLGQHHPPPPPPPPSAFDVLGQHYPRPPPPPSAFDVLGQHYPPAPPPGDHYIERFFEPMPPPPAVYQPQFWEEQGAFFDQAPPQDALDSSLAADAQPADGDHNMGMPMDDFLAIVDAPAVTTGGGNAQATDGPANQDSPCYVEDKNWLDDMLDTMELEQFPLDALMEPVLPFDVLYL